MFRTDLVAIRQMTSMNEAEAGKKVLETCGVYCRLDRVDREGEKGRSLVRIMVRAMDAEQADAVLESASI